MGLLGRSIPGRSRPPARRCTTSPRRLRRDRRWRSPPDRTRRPAAAAGVAPKDNVLRRDRHQPDWSILVAVVALAAIGILMVYSSSAMRAYVQNDNTLGIVGPQILWAALGLIAMLVLMRVDYRLLRIVSMPAYVVAIGLLILVFVPGLGRVVGGSARWLDIRPPRDPSGRNRQAGPHRLPRPLAVVAGHAHQGLPVRHDTVPAHPLPVVALVFKEPDLGTTSSSPPRLSRCSSSPEPASGSSGPWP